MIEHDDKPTLRGLRKCAEIMCEMLRLGWQKSDLDALEQLFWQVRDKNGEVKRAGGKR